MDAFSVYNQIMMNPDDQEKTLFITDRGTYCYRVMPFGLKNAGATYQRLVNRMFSGQLRMTMEVYIEHACEIPGSYHSPPRVLRKAKPAQYES